MIKASPLLVTILAIFLSFSIAHSEPIPLKEGKRYHFQFSEVKNNLPAFWPRVAPVKVVKIFDYPWVEVEYTWVPTVALEEDENGEMKSVKPAPIIYRKYLNLNQIVTISPVG